MLFSGGGGVTIFGGDEHLVGISLKGKTLGLWLSADLQTEALASNQRFEQVINKPTQILPNLLSCIDFIFTDERNLIVDNGALPSLHVDCQHQ